MSTVKSKKLQVGTDATSSNNFTIYQPATPDGTLRIGVGNADSPTEVGRFTSAGYKPATAPAFSATVSTSQTVTSSTFTKVQFPVEDFDTNSNYDNSTNYRFTPTVAGYYQINSNVSVNDNNGTAWIMIYKNGSVYIAGSRVLTDLSVIANKISQVAGLVYLNGSTDYVEIYVYHTTSPNTTLNSSPAYCRFSGILVQQA